MMEDQQPAEGERRGRDPAEQVLVDNQQQQQHRTPDISYPRSVEGIIKMISVVSKTKRNVAQLFNAFLSYILSLLH